MEKKVYRILSWKNNRLVIGISLFLLSLIVININLHTTPNANLEDLYYMTAICIILILVFMFFTYRIRCEVNIEGIKHYNIYNKLHFISWEEVKKIGLYTYNPSTKQIIEIPLSEANRTIYRSTKMLYISTEANIGNGFSNLSEGNVITFKFYKDFFETLVIGYNNYSSNRNNP